jgi:hypothetical protein
VLTRPLRGKRRAPYPRRPDAFWTLLRIAQRHEQPLGVRAWLVRPFRLCQSSLGILPPQIPLEADMRVILPTFAGFVVLAAISAQAAPLPPSKASPPELSTAPPIELARQGCGWAWHRVHWRDRWGYWHWGHCVPNW